MKVHSGEQQENKDGKGELSSRYKYLFIYLLDNNLCLPQRGRLASTSRKETQRREKDEQTKAAEVQGDEASMATSLTYLTLAV